MCYECKLKHFDQLYTHKDMDPRDKCFYQRICCNSNKCMKKQHSTSVPYFSPLITTELLLLLVVLQLLVQLLLLLLLLHLLLLLLVVVVLLLLTLRVHTRD